MSTADPEKLVETIKSKNMKLTPQRIEIIKKLIELKDDHPTLSQLYNSVRKSIPTLSFSTLYTTIQKLEELGMVKLFDLLGETRIEVNMNPHINIIDVEKGRIKDLEDRELVETIARRLNIDKDNMLINIIVYNKNREDEAK